MRVNKDIFIRNLTYLLYFKYVLRFLLGLLENHYKAYLANTGNEQGNKHCKVNKSFFQ